MIYVILIFFQNLILPIQIEQALINLSPTSKHEEIKENIEDIKNILIYSSIEYDFEISKILTLAYLESSFNPHAFNRNNNGTNDQGFFQQNSAFWNDRFHSTKNWLRDHPDLNQYHSMLKNDRKDLISNLLISIKHLKDLKDHYDLSGINVYVAHHGIGYAIYPNKYRKNRNRYLKLFNRNYKIVNKYFIIDGNSNK